MSDRKSHKESFFGGEAMDNINKMAESFNDQLAKAVESSQGFKLPSMRVPDNNIEYLISAPKSLPESAFDAIQEEIADFEEAYAADSDNVVLARLASFGREVIIQISEIHLRSQYFVVFGILENGTATRLIQHYTDFSMLLTAAPPFVETPKRTIGFTSSENTDE